MSSPKHDTKEYDMIDATVYRTEYPTLPEKNDILWEVDQTGTLIWAAGITNKGYPKPEAHVYTVRVRAVEPPEYAGAFASYNLPIYDLSDPLGRQSADRQAFLIRNFVERAIGWKDLIVWRFRDPAFGKPDKWTAALADRQGVLEDSLWTPEGEDKPRLDLSTIVPLLPGLRFVSQIKQKAANDGKTYANLDPNTFQPESVWFYEDPALEAEYRGDITPKETSESESQVTMEPAGLG